MAAYGIDPSAAVVEPSMEDGLIEEEEEEDSDEDDDDDDDDVKFELSGGAGRTIDLR